MSKLYELFKACGCRLTTDSRRIGGGELFLALKGENFDGNLFAVKALRDGAAYSIISEDAVLDIPGDLEDRIIRVPDTLAALSELARQHRQRVLEGRKSAACALEGHLPVIGLTGTNGKTTTKELIKAVLSSKYRVSATEGNLNNDIGVPLTLLSIKPDTDIAIVEMGASHPDDITKLVQVCQPDYGLITNVGRAHLQGFGSFEGVKAAKGQLYNYLGSHEGSLIFLNEDDADLRAMAASQPCHIFGYGLGNQNARVLPQTPDSPFLRLQMGEDLVETHLVGAYNAANVLCAIAIGTYFGVDRSEAIAAVSAYEPSNKRSQLVRSGDNTLIVDAYNANPASMVAAIDNFCAMQAPSKIAMLGDMRELGDDSLKEHVRIVWKLVTENLQCYLVGEQFSRAVAQLGLDPGEDCCVRGCFADSEELAQFVAAHPVSNTTVLIKGSRGILMEKVLESL